MNCQRFSTNSNDCANRFNHAHGMLSTTTKTIELSPLQQDENVRIKQN